jgi:hypothetical protein
MGASETKGQRLTALCLLGFLLFNYPVLALFHLPSSALVIPVLYAWIFFAWAVLIALMAWVVEKRE